MTTSRSSGSAGGLDASRRLLAARPAGTGMAFILIQHLDPTHASMMVDLLADHTPMKVQQAAVGMPLEREHVYLIPPGAYLSIRGGALRLSEPRERHGARLPFDFFLRSLAEELGTRAICVILSGTGGDGSLGLKAIKAKSASFISRGDRSGTHAAELALWKAAGLDIAGVDKGPWYKEIGQGMGAALNTASASNSYVLADRGTWLSFKNRGDLDIVVEGDRRLFNQYGVMLVNPAKHPHVKKEYGQQFVDWLVSADGQKAIADYKINGQQLFFPNASVPGA
jgi:hypothetical protein